MASKWVFIGGVENDPPLQELIAQKPYRSRVKSFLYTLIALQEQNRPKGAPCPHTEKEENDI